MKEDVDKAVVKRIREKIFKKESWKEKEREVCMQ